MLPARRARSHVVRVKCRREVQRNFRRKSSSERLARDDRVRYVVVSRLIMLRARRSRQHRRRERRELDGRGKKKKKKHEAAEAHSSSSSSSSTHSYTLPRIETSESSIGRLAAAAEIRAFITGYSFTYARLPGDSALFLPRSLPLRRLPIALDATLSPLRSLSLSLALSCPSKKRPRGYRLRLFDRRAEWPALADGDSGTAVAATIRPEFGFTKRAAVSRWRRCMRRRPSPSPVSTAVCWPYSSVRSLGQPTTLDDDDGSDDR